jgi:hypothetical protein
MNSIKNNIIAVIIIVLFAATHSFAAETPKEVVAQFCKLDFEGHRLNPDTYMKIALLVMYPSEPRWATVLGVSRYEITDETIEGNTAKVTVYYEIDRSWPETIRETNMYKTEIIILNQENGKWKISKQIMFPRVSSKLLCTKYKFCLAGS